MGDRISLSFFVDSPLDETLNRGLLALLLRRQYEFPFGINIVQFLIFNFQFSIFFFNFLIPGTLCDTDIDEYQESHRSM